MKKLRQTLVIVLGILTLTAFTSSSLKQKGAERAIEWFIIMHNASDLARLVAIVDVIKIQPLERTSDKQVMCTVVTKAKVATSEHPANQCDYQETTLTIGFYFKKNDSNVWYLSGVAKCASKWVPVNPEILKKFMEQNQNGNIEVTND